MAEATHLRLALAQIDPTVGDIESNVRLISESIEQAREAGAQLVLLPELCVSGYPPEDLVLRRDFLEAVREGLDEVASATNGIVALVGFPERVERAPEEPEHFDPLIDPPPPPAHNSLAVLAGGELRGIYRKCDLPNYGVFDERRYFEPGTEPALIEVDGVPIGLTVCEDIWHPGFPESEEVAAGARLIVNSSASPYHRGKGQARERMIADPIAGEEAEVYTALTVGLRDYVEKNGFEHVVLALSGGIDSALVALIAVDALGADRVSVVVMPSPHSSPETQADARTIAANLGVELIEIPIAEPMQAYDGALATSFEGTEPGLAEENVQARIRGNLVMALSNKFGWLVLTTGNKSETSVGYATLYGDMAGGFAVIKDVFKTLVYRLVRWRNEQEEGGELIP